MFVCEGEKDVDLLIQQGLTATTNPMGAGKWRPEYSGYLEGRHVVVLPDNDGEGRSHAEKVAYSVQSIARSVRVVELSGLPEGGGDVSDWLDQGHTDQELMNWRGMRQSGNHRRSRKHRRESSGSNLQPILHVRPRRIPSGSSDLLCRQRR